MEPLCAARPVHYSIAPGAWASLLLAFDLDAERLPAQQLAALLWMSYHVGMEMPGRQALFADAQSRYTVAVYDRNLPFNYRGSFPTSRPHEEH